MPRGKWSAHDERKYEAILSSCTAAHRAHRGRKAGATKACKRIAAATVNRDRALADLGLGNVFEQSLESMGGARGTRGLRGGSLDDAAAKYKARQAAEREEGIRAGKERHARMREIEAKYPGTYPGLLTATYPGFDREFPGRGMGGFRGAREMLDRRPGASQYGDFHAPTVRDMLKRHPENARWLRNLSDADLRAKRAGAWDANLMEELAQYEWEIERRREGGDGGLRGGTQALSMTIPRALFAGEFAGLRGTPAEHRAAALKKADAAERSLERGDYSRAFVSAVAANNEAQWTDDPALRKTTFREFQLASDPNALPRWRPRADTDEE